MNGPFCLGSATVFHTGEAAPLWPRRRTFKPITRRRLDPSSPGKPQPVLLFFRRGLPTVWTVSCVLRARETLPDWP